jgi:fatty-acyl-CoA synthase
MTHPTPSLHPGQTKRHADFGSIAEALDYAAQGPTGLNFYTGKGTLAEILPYALLRQQAISLARQMLGAGLAPGARIGLVADSDGDFARAFFACQYAGLVPVPLPLPAAFGGKSGYISHLRRMIERADAAAAFGPLATQEWLGEAVEGLGLQYAGTLAVLNNAPAFSGDLPAQHPDNFAYLQFSSGSTRFPVGVAVTQRAFMANAQGMGRDGLVLVDGDRAVSWLPFYHDMGLIGFLLMPMACQVSVDILPTREFARRPLLWLSLISRNRGTISFSPSFGYELCVRRAQTMATNDLDLSSWRSAGIGGDMIRPNVLADFASRFAGCGFDARAFVPSYGMAEVTLALSYTPSGQGVRHVIVDTATLENEHRAIPPGDPLTRTRTFVLCGKVLPGHALEVHDEADNLLPDRHVGRIFIRGPSLMTGYFGAPAETAHVLSADGWLDTGDLGYLLDGQIVITGRAKDLIIVNGRNLWPQDLEWAVEAEIPALRSGDVAVFSVDHDAAEEVIVLVQCRTPDATARAALSNEIAGTLRGHHGVETKIVLVPPHSLPQTSSGKLSRSRARAMYLDGVFAAQPTSAAAE